jgi:predicted Zn-dependent protease
VELLESEKVTEARAAFQRLLEEEPGFLPAVLMLGEAELEAGDEEAALRAWREGFEATGSPIFLQRIEDHFIERAAPARAIETLRALIAGAERDLLPRFYLGRLYHRLEMHEDALRVLEALRDDLEESPVFHFLLGRIHERRGEMRRAVDSLLTCLEKAGFPTSEYRCRVCGRAFAEWRDHCERCGSWNAVGLDIGEEGTLPEELGIREAPVWTVYEDEEGETGA